MERKPTWTRLSLDLGTNSIGWMLFALDKPNKGKPVGIIKSGVRIFPSGRTPQDLSLNKSRREARGARRLRARYLQRRKHLMEAMMKHGLMPKDEAERKALQKLNPFELRALAVERELSPYHVGRALFHLNQRRGFKSNRIQIMGDDKEEKNDSKIVGEAIEKSWEKLGAEGSKTLGAYLWKLQQKDESVRARPRHGEENLYDFYPDRKMLMDEFNQIWEKQSGTQPSIFNASAQKEIKEIIFKQRPWTAPPPGKCTYDPNEDRAHRASPIFQEYKIWQALSNLEIRVIGRPTPYRFTELKQETRNEILKKLSKQKSMQLSTLKTILKRVEKIEGDISFNFEKEIPGDETGAAVKKAGWPESLWLEWPLLKREDFIDCLLNYKPEDNEECINKLVDSFGLDIDTAEKGIKAVTSLPTGHAKLSKKVMNKILLGMKEGKDWYSAKEEFEAVSQFDDGGKGKLPHYAEVIKRYTVERESKKKNPKERDPRIPNPTVHIALNQLRKVINDIIRIYGKPQEIYLELARELPLGEVARKKLKARDAKNRKKRENARKCLEELGMPTNNQANIERVLMWKELGESPHDRRCVYTGEAISKSELFSDKIQIDHILPRKPFCDDSRANKILVYQKANQYKGNRTPEEAFKGSRAKAKGYDWEDILKRAQKLPAGKRKRFYQDARKKFLDERKFLDNQLTDTSYIGKVAREYLTAICPKNKVRVRPGRLTGQLRYAWGLNSILGEHNKKNREDHRHHAVDAAVVGITNERILQDIATAFQDENKKRLIDAIESVERPWGSFYDDVKKSIDGIIVSHKPGRKASGKLHEAYAYGIIEDSNPDDLNQIKLFRHKPLSDLSKEDFRNIVNKKLMEKLSDLLPNGTREMEEEELRKKLETLGNPKKKIRRVRIKESPSKIIPIRHKKGGKPYKYFKPGSNWAYEIFCLEGTWHGEIISLFDAAKGTKFTPEWRADPHAEEVMRIHKNDMLILEIEEQKKIVYAKSISEDDIRFIEHNKANTNEQIRIRSISKLQEANARKIHVSPSGLVYDPGPPTPQE